VPADLTVPCHLDEADPEAEIHSEDELDSPILEEDEEAYEEDDDPQTWVNQVTKKTTITARAAQTNTLPPSIHNPSFSFFHLFSTHPQPLGYIHPHDSLASSPLFPPSMGTIYLALIYRDLSTT